jgi:hypothetical protein
MGSCDGSNLNIDWNPVAAAEAQSAFSAVLAGFVFIGVVQIMTDDKRRYHGATLMLFLAAFLCLAASSYLGTLIAGEAVCLRAWSESLFSGSLMAVGATTMLTALVWLLPREYGANATVRRFSLACTILIALVVTELLTTNARGLLYDVPAWRQWRDRVLWYLPATLLLLVAMWIVRYRRLRNSNAETIWRRQRRRVAVASTVVLAHVLASLVVLGHIGDLPANQWDPPSTQVMALTILQPMVGAALALAAVIWATPTKHTWHVTSTPKRRTPSASPIAATRWRHVVGIRKPSHTAAQPGDKQHPGAR